MIIESIITGPFVENSWILGDSQTRHAIIFDPGDNASTIVAKLSELGLTPIFILNTHAHPDHIGAAAELQKRFELPFAIHEDDIPIFNSARETAQLLGFPNFQTPEITNFLHDGQLLEINSHHLQVMHTPGHTPGSACYHIGSDLIAGDTLFVFGCGRCDLAGGNPEEMFHTLKKMKAELPSTTLLHPGHNYAPQSPTSTMETQCSGNPFLHFDEPADFVKYRMHVHDKIRDTPYGAVSKENAYDSIK